MRAENEARRHSRATLRYQLIVDVLQIDRAPARTLCLDLLPLIEEPQGVLTLLRVDAPSPKR